MMRWERSRSTTSGMRCGLLTLVNEWACATGKPFASSIGSIAIMLFCLIVPTTIMSAGSVRQCIIGRFRSAHCFPRLMTCDEQAAVHHRESESRGQREDFFNSVLLLALTSGDF